MTTLENTISMIKALPESDLLEIQKLTTKLFQRRHKSKMTDAAADEAIGTILQSKSKQEIIQDLELSRQQVTEGKCTKMEQAIAGIKTKYGL